MKLRRQMDLSRPDRPMPQRSSPYVSPPKVDPMPAMRELRYRVTLTSVYENFLIAGKPGSDSLISMFDPESSRLRMTVDKSRQPGRLAPESGCALKFKRDQT